MDVCLAFKSKWVNLRGLILKETECQQFFKKRLQHRCFPVKIARFLEHLWKTSAKGWYCSESDNSSKEKSLASCSLCNSPVLRSTILSKKLNFKIKLLAKFKSESFTIHNSDILSHAQSPVWQGDESNKSFLKLSDKNARIKNETLIMSWKKINVVLACTKINI